MRQCRAQILKIPRVSVQSHVHILEKTMNHTRNTFLSYASMFFLHYYLKMVGPHIQFLMNSDSLISSSRNNGLTVLCILARLRLSSLRTSGSQHNLFDGAYLTQTQTRNHVQAESAIKCPRCVSLISTFDS